MEFSAHNVLVAFTIEGEVTMEKLQESMYQLIVETSTNLPKDVRRAIQQAKERENAGTRFAMALGTITIILKWLMITSHQFAKIQGCQRLKSIHQLV